jgi:hypothetical protein
LQKAIVSSTPSTEEANAASGRAMVMRAGPTDAGHQLAAARQRRPSPMKPSPSPAPRPRPLQEMQHARRADLHQLGELIARAAGCVSQPILQPVTPTAKS